MTRFPSPLVVLPLVAVCMLAVVAFAFIADCVRLNNAAKDMVDIADQDLLTLESRLVRILNTSSQRSAETTKSLKAYDESEVPAARQTAFLQLVDSFEANDARNANVESNQGKENAAEIRVANRQMDEVRGVVNRWRVSMQSYELQIENLNQYRRSKRGKVAGLFVTP